MRVVTALLFALAVAGCGTEGEVGSPSASSGEGRVVTVSVTESEIDPPELQPPPIVHDSANGPQTAVEGSYCIGGTLGLTVAGGKKWDALGVGAVKPSMEVCALN
jgi:hypothetical protein